MYLDISTQPANQHITYVKSKVLNNMIQFLWKLSAWALFSSQKLVKNGTVALSFLFDKHCSIIE